MDKYFSPGPEFRKPWVKLSVNISVEVISDASLWSPNDKDMLAWIIDGNGSLQSASYSTAKDS